METNIPWITSQEKIAAILGSMPFLFFFPHLMEKKTDFTLPFMKQGFGLTLISLIMSMIERVPFFGILRVVDFLIFVAWIYLAWNAWEGKKIILPYLLEYSEKLSCFLVFLASFLVNFSNEKLYLIFNFRYYGNPTNDKRTSWAYWCWYVRL